MKKEKLEEAEKEKEGKKEKKRLFIKHCVKAMWYKVSFYFLLAAKPFLGSFL